MGKNKGMKTIHAWYGAALLLFGSLVSCMGTVGNSSMRGGEVIGASAVAWNEPAPYGMVLVKRGSVKWAPTSKIACGEQSFLHGKFQSSLSGWMIRK